MRSLYLLFFVAFFAQCKKTDSNLVDFGKEYFPIEVGFWQEYQVDSITFSDFTNPVSVDTASYQIKETIESSFLDLNLEENFRIEQFKKTSSTAYSIENIFSLKPTTTNIQKVENDLRFIKMVFPVVEGKSWNGNIYIDVTDEATLDFLNVQKYPWEYIYTEVNATQQIGAFTFDSCVTIIQIDDENLFEKKYSKEIYAKNVGLVYKELMILETQAPPSSASFEERAENGFILKYTILDYKK